MEILFYLLFDISLCYIGFHDCSKQWRLVCTPCGTATPSLFTLYFVFRSAYCFTWIFSFGCTRSVGNVSSLHKTYCTKFHITHIFTFVWEALQMTKTWSCGECQRQSRSRNAGVDSDRVYVFCRSWRRTRSWNYE